MLLSPSSPSGFAGHVSPFGLGMAAPREARSVVPLAGIEPALLAELDFESSASTSSATGALGRPLRKEGVAKPADYSHGKGGVNPRQSDP